MKKAIVLSMIVLVACFSINPNKAFADDFGAGGHYTRSYTQTSTSGNHTTTHIRSRTVGGYVYAQTDPATKDQMIDLYRSTIKPFIKNNRHKIKPPPGNPGTAQYSTWHYSRQSYSPPAPPKFNPPSFNPGNFGNSTPSMGGFSLPSMGSMNMPHSGF